MRTLMRAPRRVLPGLALAFSGLALFAGTPPSVQFEGVLDVRAVDVEAVVTDRSGARIEGLEAQDFLLTVDGKEVPIDYFNEVREGETVQSSGEVENPTADAPAAPAIVNYLVFLDESLVIGAQRDFVMRRMVEGLDRMRPADRMAVVVFDGRGLTRLIDWTSDRAEVERALTVAMGRPARGIVRSLDGLGGLDTNPGLRVADDYEPVERAILAGAASLRGMSVPLGRKVLLLLTGGWPIPTNWPKSQYSFLTVDGNADLKEFYRPLTDAANLLGYSVYPVDVSGYDPSYSWGDASRTGPTDFTRPIGSEWERATDAGLEQMARETGGKAILNAARLDAFARAASDTKSYYALGFSPSWQADGRRHDIRLEVRRSGLRVRARKSFTDLQRTTEVALRDESLLFFGGDAAFERLRLAAGNPVKAGFGKFEVPIEVEMPAGALTPRPTAEGTLLQGILSLEALDRRGKRSARKVFDLRIPEGGGDPGGGIARYEARVVLPKGEHHLVFILRDQAGNGESWGALDLEAAAPPGRGPL